MLKFLAYSADKPQVFFAQVAGSKFHLSRSLSLTFGSYIHCARNPMQCNPFRQQVRHQAQLANYLEFYMQLKGYLR